MANRDISAFFQQADRDPSIREKLDGLPEYDPDGALSRVVEIAAEAGFELGRDELQQALVAHAEGGELNMDQLDRVVGGASYTTSSSFSTLSGMFSKTGAVGPCFTPTGAVGPCFKPKGVIAPCD